MLQNLDLMYIQEKLELSVSITKTIFFFLFVYYTNFKITNQKMKLNLKILVKIMCIIILAVIYEFITLETNLLISTTCAIFMISIIFSKSNIGNSIVITTISIAINYIIKFIAITIVFAVNTILGINNNWIELINIIFFHFFILFTFFKIKKLKHGISFLQKNAKNEYIDMLTLNISVIILFCIILISISIPNVTIFKNITTGLIILSVMMFFTIQKSLNLYYKQKLLDQELKTTKEQLASKTKEVEELETENIEISKKAHTLTHKQKSLEHKLEELMSKAEISQEEAAEVRERLNEIKKDLHQEKTAVELDKTGIAQIDDMLTYMQSECKKNKIDFELQLKGNIHYMTNNLITKEDLETLLADHIKNAIIAINHTDNVNRSILVRLGELDGTYSLFIYDSGIEFKTETLENLGKKPSTTHKDEGGTGMGFMNTFDTLRKCKASLIIEEYNEPSKDNYTKAIMIKFDNKNEFKINSYRQKEVNKI